MSLAIHELPARQVGEPSLSPAPWFGEPVRTSYGQAYAVELPALQDTRLWPRLLGGAKRDHRFWPIVEETLRQEFEHRYLVLQDGVGAVRGIMPFFVHAQDLLGGSRGRAARAVGWLRRAMPRLLTMRTLMVGSPVGEAALGCAPADAAWCGSALAEALPACAKRCRASLVVVKELPASHRAALSAATDDGFVRIPSMPHTSLDIDFAGFDEYMQRSLSKSTRKGLRRKFRDAAKAPPITMEVASDITSVVDELHPLYLQVYERSSLRFEKLTKEYLARIGREMPDKARFFIWRQGGKAVAFSVCTLHDGALWDEYLGMDYQVALDLHLYFYTLRDVINWCCDHGVRRYYSSALNYDPKLHLRFRLAPLDLYVRHANSWLNPVFKRVVRWLDPTRSEPALRQFANAEEL